MKKLRKPRKSVPLADQITELDRKMKVIEARKALVTARETVRNLARKT